jgi:hypothetical protein
MKLERDISAPNAAMSLLLQEVGKEHLSAAARPWKSRNEAPCNKLQGILAKPNKLPNVKFV